MATTIERQIPPTVGRRLAAWLHRRPAVRAAGLLAGPVGWLVVVYVGSLLILFLNAFWSRDAFSGATIYEPTLRNFAELLDDPYPGITLRTVLMAALVTVTCAALALPVAYYMARVASPRIRNALVVAVIVPLWASYLIKVYSWRLILAEQGILNWALAPLGLRGPGFGDVAVWLVFTYLWLPYMILPVYAGLSRIPDSLFEASADLGARPWMTMRRIVLPLAMPAIVAGSIFTFSLTLGDYIAPATVSTTIFIGNAIFSNFGAGNFPLAAALSLVPLVIVLLYLLVARRLGAFEAL
ncbi:MAG TPA: ABC transporter permease [Candidatus Binatia bacterium]|nr:ABC transporter permease [Candidatus Binatia bacterium]